MRSLIIILFGFTFIGTPGIPETDESSPRDDRAGETRKKQKKRPGPFDPGAKIWSPPKNYDMFKAMTSKDQTLAEFAASDFGGRRLETIEAALDVLRSRKKRKVDDKRLVRCMEILGLRFRAAEAVPELIELLTYRPPKYFPDVKGESQPYEYYPAAKALQYIGAPAVHRLLRLIADKKSTAFQRKMATWVLLRIELAGVQDYASSEADYLIKREVIHRLDRWAGTIKDRRDPNFVEAIKFVKTYKEQIGTPEEIRGFILQPTRKPKRKPKRNRK